MSFARIHITVAGFFLVRVRFNTTERRKVFMYEFMIYRTILSVVHIISRRDQFVEQIIILKRMLDS